MRSKSGGGGGETEEGMKRRVSLKVDKGIRLRRKINNTRMYVNRSLTVCPCSGRPGAHQA